MKILILSNKSGAMISFRYDLIKRLLDMSSITISTPFDDLMDELQELPVKLIETSIDRRGVNPIKDIRLLFDYLHIIKAEKPNLIVSYTIKPNIYGGLASRIKKVPLAANITGLGTAFEGNRLLKTVVTILYRISLKKAKVVFFENSANLDVFLSEGIINKEQACLLSGAGVNLDHFNYTPYPHNDVVKFLFIGRVMQEKGIDELFEAMKRLIGEGENCFLDVVGPFEEDYKDKLEEYEKTGWLKYHGYQKDVRPFIADCDCFVLPSYHEGMANTNLECAAMGRPVITSNIPGCKEAVIEYESGLTCNPKDITSLYNAMKYMLHMSIRKREQLGVAGRNLMKEVFDKDRVVQKTIEKLMG